MILPAPKKLPGNWAPTVVALEIACDPKGGNVMRVGKRWFQQSLALIEAIDTRLKIAEVEYKKPFIKLILDERLQDDWLINDYYSKGDCTV